MRAQGVYETTPEAPDLALVRLPAEWNFRAVSPTPTGLACTCDGWPPTTRVGPGDGLYCTDILAYLLALYLEQPPSPLPYTPEKLWQLALDELRLQMTRATFNQWLVGSTVVPEASTPLSLTVAVRNQYAQWWLTHRLHHIIARTLGALATVRVPVVSIVLGEGTGGGALALMPADRTVCAEHGWVAPLPPEGASAIVHRTGERAAEMAQLHRIRAVDLRATGVVDQIVPEHPDASREPDEFCRRIVGAAGAHLAELLAMPRTDRLQARHDRYRSMS